MLQVIRLSIADPRVLKSLSEKDVGIVSKGAMNTLEGSDVRSFIYSCFTSQAEDKGLAMVNAILAYAEAGEQADYKTRVEMVGAAVGTLSILSESNPILKNKVLEFLEHQNPSIVSAAVENLGHTTNLDNFKRICGLLLRREFEVSLSAAKYIEACTRDAAFRNRRDEYAIETAAEDFLRKALVPLESAYEQLKQQENGEVNIKKRIALLVAMIYNEILDSTDWKRVRNEQVEERIYYTLEQHLSEYIGPEAVPFLLKIVSRPSIEGGIKRSALNTLGRMSKQERYRDLILDGLEDIVADLKSDYLVDIARNILESCQEGRHFSSVPPMAPLEERSSIIPRTVGAPPKIED